MNCKLEKFWNNLENFKIKAKQIMNCKLEKFWNLNKLPSSVYLIYMNCKLEKFWNEEVKIIFGLCELWTVNLKSFEMA